MKSPNSTEISELQFHISRKLNEVKTRKIRSNNSNSKNKHKGKEVRGIKWHTINKFIQRIQKQNKNFHKTKTIKVVEPVMKTENLFDIVNRIMLLQKSLIALGEDVAKYRRLQMLCIFFQCSLAIVFNAYNLVVFLLKIANRTGDVPLSLTMLLFFYGYHITSSAIDIVLSVMAYSSVYESIRETARKMDELNIYILDTTINCRISQLSAYIFNNLKTFTLFGLYNIDGALLTSILSGTTTYIIILIQYSGDGEICKTAGNLRLNETKNSA